MFNNEQKEEIRDMLFHYGFKEGYDNKNYFYIISSVQGSENAIVEYIQEEFGVFSLSFEEIIEEVFNGTAKFVSSKDYDFCGYCELVVKLSQNYGIYTDYDIDKYNVIVCGDCIREYPNYYIESLINNPDKVNTIVSNETIEDFGFEFWNTVEDNDIKGFGSSNTNDVYKRLQHDYDVIFSAQKVRKFGIDVFVKASENKKDVLSYENESYYYDSDEDFSYVVRVSFKENRADIEEFFDLFDFDEAMEYYRLVEAEGYDNGLYNYVEIVKYNWYSNREEEIYSESF